MMSSSPPPPSHNQNSNSQSQNNQFNFLLSSPQTFLGVGDFQFNDLNPILLSDDFTDTNTHPHNLDFYTTAASSSNLTFDNGINNNNNNTQQQQQHFIDNDDFLQMTSTQLENTNHSFMQSQSQSQSRITPSSSSSSSQIRKSYSNNSLPPQMLYQPQSPQQNYQHQQQPQHQNQQQNQQQQLQQSSSSHFLTPLRLNHKRNKSKLIEKSPLHGSGNPFYIPNQISPKIQKRTHKKNSSITNSKSFNHLDNDLNLNLNSPLDHSPRLKEEEEAEEEEDLITALDSHYVIPTLIEKNSLSNLQLPLNTLIEDKLDSNMSSIYGDYNHFESLHQPLHQPLQPLQQQQQQQQSQNGEFNYLMNNDHLIKNPKNPSQLETVGNSKRIQRSKSNFNLTDIAITRSRSSSSVHAPASSASAPQLKIHSQSHSQIPPPLPNQFVHPNTLRQPQSAPLSQFESMYVEPSTTTSSSSASNLPNITPPSSSNIHIIESTTSPKRRTRRSTTSGASTPSSSTTSNSSNIKFPERLDLPYQSARSKSRSKKGGLNENKKIHECPLCSMKFQRPEHVKRHMLSHSSEKPFLCPELNCGKRFNRNDNLKQHLRNIHKKKI